ncbi:Putative glycosyltransferase EpsF [Candidatus Magnetaquicoccaceae bacterium FCR-1]|uniref:Glycosyltransferase EpsF n=1 Tax=Candidatus Magnetaquiglobus chichijimensis TaxID=3141448 RepID=A0ABQ0C9K7_9PROT
MRIAIIITGLGIGGAEIMLYKLLERMDRQRFQCHVFSLTQPGEIGQRIQALGIPVESLDLSRSVFKLGAVFTLVRRLKTLQIDLVNTWMYHADLIGGLAARAAGVRQVIWGIRTADFVRSKEKRATRFIVRINARLSHWVPVGIISCSEAAREVHDRLGYRLEKITVIPNGFDVARFVPDASARISVRQELHVDEDTPLVGIVGRHTPQKNHVGFFEAAERLRRRHPRVRFVVVGRGFAPLREKLAGAMHDTGLDAAIHWLGQREDMPRLMASLDLLASSSDGEGFPNVLGEAMACGVPCVVTDVGDSAFIVGQTGRVVPVGDMAGLAAAMGDLLSLSTSDRLALGRQARIRVREHFEIGGVVRRYEAYFLAHHPGSGSRG